MAESMDMVYRFMALDAGAAAAFTGLSEKARVAAASTGNLTAATLKAADAERLAAAAASRSAEVRLQASAALAEAKRLEVAGDAQAAAAAREAADALALQARAAAATSRELNANALAASRQAAVIRESRAATMTSATSLRGLIGHVSGLSGAMATIPTPVGIVAGALGTLAKRAAQVGLVVAGVSIDIAQKFQTAMTRLSTQANVSNRDVTTLSKGILAMAGSVGTTPTVLAGAAYHIASVGQHSLTAAQQLQVLRVAAEGAKIGGADLVDVTNALDAAIISGMRGVRNYAQTMGVLNATVGAGDMSMQDLADALGPLGSTFKGFNVSIQQAGAALAVLGDNNIRGALAGQQLRQSVTALAMPLKFGQEQLQKWGIHSGNLAAQLAHGGLSEALRVLSERLHRAGYTAKTMGPILAQMFGKRGPQQGLSTLINQLQRYQGKLHEVSHDGSAFHRAWQRYTKTFKFNWDAAQASLAKVGVELGQRLLPIAVKVLHWIATDGVKDLDRFGHWFERNKGTMATFAAAWVGAMDAIATSALTGFGIVVDAAAKAGSSLTVFGGVLGNVFGSKAQKAASDFDAFRKTTLDTMNSLVSGLLSVANQGVGPAEAVGENIGSALAGGIARGAALKAGLALSVANQIAAGVGADFAKKHGGKHVHVNVAPINIPSVSVAPIATPSPVSIGSSGSSGSASTTGSDLATSAAANLQKLTQMWRDRVKAAVQTLRQARASLRQELAAEHSDIRNMAAGFQSDLSNVFSTDVLGNAQMGNVNQFFGAQIGPLKRFARDLALAKKMGLANGLLQQISALGPMQGDEVLQQIIGSGKAGVQQLDTYQRQIDRFSRAAASTVVSGTYARQLKHLREQEHKDAVALHHLQREQVHLLRQIARHGAGHGGSVRVVLPGGRVEHLTVAEARDLVRWLRKLERKGIKV